MKRLMLFAAGLSFTVCSGCNKPKPAPKPPIKIPAVTLSAAAETSSHAASQPQAPASSEPQLETSGEQTTSSEPSIEAAQRKILVRDCLLRLPEAERVRTSAAPQERERLAALVDNDANTATVLPATAALPLEVVYHFGGAEVSAHELVVLLPESSPPDARTSRVEVLASSVSADAGYQFLRADPLEATDRVQRFRLRPQAAKWILLRFTPALASPRVAVAEVALLGRVGPPESSYAFKDSPAKAIDVLEKLKDLAGVSVALTPDETALVGDVKDGKLQTWSLADAVLLVSGVAEAERRKDYLAHLDDLKAKAKQEAGAGGIEEKGTRLLEWLHAYALGGGYEANQTDLPPILDHGRFNCVSSALLYNILARDMGLDARCVETPEHAFSIVYDGARYFDVETTTPLGFNPVRDPQAIADFERRTGFNYIPDSHRELRRETTDAGMLALVYYNHGVMLLEQGRYAKALGSFFRALSLDQELASASKGALIALARWGVDESGAGRFDAARQVVGAGLELAPDDARLRYARVHIWSEHAQRELEQSGVDAALAVLRQAAVEAPEGPFTQLQAWLFLQPGEELLAAKRWEDAIALVEPALEKVDPPAREELLRWRGGVFLHWVNDHLAAGRFEEALAIVERAIQLHPQDARFPDLLAAVARNWVQTAHREQGAEAAQKAVAALQERAQTSPALSQAVREAPYWLILQLQEEGKYDEAEALLASLNIPTGGAAPLDAAEVLRRVFDTWAWTLLEKEDYRGAFDVYVRALARLPGDAVLLDHLSYVVQRWSRSVEASGGADAVKALIAQLEQEHPDLKDHIAVTPATAWSSIRKLRDANEFAAALGALDRWAPMLDEKDKEDAHNMYLHLFDAWADERLEANDFATAVNVYEQGLHRFPESSHLQNNVAAIIQRQALKVRAAGQEGEAKRIVLDALARFPEIKDVQNAIRDYVPLVVQELRRADRYAEALDMLDRHLDLLQELHGQDARKEHGEIGRSVFHVWARDYTDQQQWDKALEVYKQGVQRFPQEDDLRSGLASVYDQWAKTHIEKKEWSQAIEIYDRGLKAAPDSRLLKNNREYCVEMQKESQ